MTEQWRTVTRLERADFYAEWLALSEGNELGQPLAGRRARPRARLDRDRSRTHRIAMLIGEQVGFPTKGTNLCKAVIPAGHHTGRHRHGEEAIHILSGAGFIVVDGRRYDFHAGTTIHVPYHVGSPALQHAGPTTSSTSSASAMDLDLFVRLGRLEQLEHEGRQRARLRGSRSRPRMASSTSSGGGSRSTSRTLRTSRSGARSRAAAPPRRRAGRGPRRRARARSWRRPMATATLATAMATAATAAPDKRRTPIATARSTS